MYKLKIITSTVRPGRKGPLVAEWVAEVAKQENLFDVDVLELGALNLPLMNEPHHPRMRNYQFDYSKQWSAKIDEADAFIFVTAEYDYGYPAALRNALEYLFFEWGYKAAGIVSYGGLSGGTRAANALKADLSTLGVVPLQEMVNIPFFTQFITENEQFSGSKIRLKTS
jgi:NAD(P)H-dependent FMN reductase